MLKSFHRIRWQAQCEGLEIGRGRERWCLWVNCLAIEFKWDFPSTNIHTMTICERFRGEFPEQVEKSSWVALRRGKRERVQVQQVLKYYQIVELVTNDQPILSTYYYSSTPASRLLFCHRISPSNNPRDCKCSINFHTRGRK